MLVAAGSEGKTGAATLAAEGALHVGAGLVTLVVPRSLNPIFETKLTEAMTVPVEDHGQGRLSEEAIEAVLRESHERDALVLGPGLGLHEGTVRLLEGLVPELRIPVVIDADGLNAFAGRPEALRGPGPRILTPHPGEAARLLECGAERIQADRVAAARELVSIPVLGPGMASMYVTSALADKFSLLVQLPHVIGIARRQVRDLGLQGRCAGIYSVGLPVLELGRPESFERVRETAVASIEEGGADAICFGCMGLNDQVVPLTKALAESHPGVLVIHPGQAVIRLSELIVDMGLSHSKRSFPNPAKDVRFFN